MKITNILWGVLGVLIIAFIIYAVATGEGEPGEKEVIKIGFAAPLTGEASTYGVPIKRGAEIALEKINQEGINGKKLELIFEDTKCDGKEAITIANKLINVDKISAIIGTVCSGVTLPMAPVVEENQILLLSAGSSAPAIKDAGSYIFTIYPLDNYEVGMATEFVYDNLNKRKIAVLYIGNEFGEGAKNVIEERFQAKGGEIVIAERYDAAEADFRTHLTKIKSSEADALIIWGYGKEMIPIFTQIKELDLQLPIVTSSISIETEELQEAGTELAENVIYTIFKTAQNENIDYLNQEYQKLHNRDDGWFPTLGYDVVLLIADAIKNGGLTGTEMKNYLHTVKNFSGASGTMSFDEDGTVVKEFEFKTVKDGEFVEYQPESTE